MSKVVRPSRATTDDVVLSDGWCDKLRIMGIPNAKKYRIRRPDSSAEATIVAVLPKNSDVQAYLADAAKRFDWKAFDEQKAAMTKIRVGQQKQRKR